MGLWGEGERRRTTFGLVGPDACLNGFVTTALRWLIASIVAVTAGSVTGIWLDGGSGMLVRTGCSIVGIICAVTAFALWFKESQQ